MHNRRRSWPVVVVALAFVALLAALPVAGGGCGKSKSPPPAPPAAPATGAPAAPIVVPVPAPGHVSGTPHTNKVIHALKGAGLEPEGFATTDPARFGASFCEYGRVNAIDALVCEFPDSDALERGKKMLSDEWGREGVQTGVTAFKERTMLALTDRGHHDPNGKTINQIVSAFKKP